MAAAANDIAPFRVNDCALIAIATGRNAQNLKELRDELAEIDTSSIYYHFWGGLLRPGFEEREFNNDFAEWVRHTLHDHVLAERLAVIDPSEYPTLEDMRLVLVETIEDRLDERDHLEWAAPDGQFEFVRSQIVVFPTDAQVDRPDQLAPAMLRMSPGSLFYHFIDARRRLAEGTDDFRAWLAAFGDAYEGLCRRIADVDPYFTTLSELRRQVASLLVEAFTEGGP